MGGYKKGEINQQRVNREHFLKDKLNRLDHQQDIVWKQRAHVKWLHSGDKNTAFFHAFASERKRRNTIRRLKRDDGSWVDNTDQLKEHISNYFFSLFSSAAGHNNEEILRAVQPRVSEQMNEILCSEYTEEEIKNALDSIGDLKAPGPDGMPAVFFKRFWNIIGNQVTKEVLNVLRGGEMPDGWNNTMIVLIPKTAAPDNLKDLRPISLCNVVYKLISKVLTNRLKLVLPDLISPNQSAFVPGQMISDNIILAYELTHFLQRKRTRNKGYAAIKLDMSKAYDRVEWKFLHEMMLRMGFDRRWTELVMKCVTTVKYQVKINGDATDTIIPERGLRQDDSLLLIEANASSIQEVNRILNTYEACSGQAINKDKCAILFSRNTKAEDKSELMNQLGISKEGFSGKYLGLPVYIGKSKAKAFQYLKEKIWNKLQGWKEKMLSKAGKEILIKAAAQAIPVYAMACFDLTKTLCDDISTMIGQYWWSNMDKENKIHWVSWENLTKPKKDGGLGFRDLYSFNLAMLARQAWRILKSPLSLCSQVLAAKYFPDHNLLQDEPKNGISYCWRSILKGVQVLKNGIVWRVGDGENINIWTDPWLPKGISRMVTSRRGNNLLTKVAELIDPVFYSWDEQLIKKTFNEQDAQAILQIPIQEGAEDFLAWHFDKKGNFSVKSAYQVVLDSEARESEKGIPSMSHNPEISTNLPWKKLWALHLPGKILHFLWRLANNSLPFRTKLKRRGIDLDTRCPICYRLDEDGGHCFLKCKSVKALWRVAQLEDIRKLLLNCPNARLLMNEIFQLGEETCMKTCVLLWTWWSERNKANQGNHIRSLDEILFSYQLHLTEFCEVMTRRKKLKRSTQQGQVT